MPEKIILGLSGNRTFWEVIIEKIALADKASQSQVNAMDVVLLGKANAEQVAWTDLELLSGVTFDVGAKPQFYKDTLGVVHLRGIAFADASNTRNIGTLPVGCRPSQLVYFPGISSVGVVAVKVGVNTDGTVSIESANSPGLNTRLDNVRFRAEQ